MHQKVDINNEYLVISTISNIMTLIKVALIGDGCVGKTCLFTLMNNLNSSNYKFNKKYDATRGFNLTELTFESNSGKINLHLWDTAGQEKFGNLRDAYLKGADVVLCLYDVNNWRTAKHVDNWLKNVKRICGSVPVFVIGNKIDEKKLDDLRSASLRDSHLRSIYGSKNVWNYMMSVKENTWRKSNSGYFSTSYSLESGGCERLLRFIVSTHLNKKVELKFNVSKVYEDDDF